MSFLPITPLPSSKHKRLSFESLGSPLFSPSAAARYAAQAEQWNQVLSPLTPSLWKVDKWLARVFAPNRVPQFERNEETLSYLHALSDISMQRTKEKKALLIAQKQMIEKYAQNSNDLENTLKTAGLGLDTLDTETVELLEELVEIGMALGVDPLNATSFDIAKALSDQIDCEHDLQLRLHEAHSLKTALEEDLESMTSLKTQLEQAQRVQEAQQDTIDEKISEWTRGIKLIQAKTEEYVSRTITVKGQSLSFWANDRKFQRTCG
jgi:hypothetical protein